MAITNHFGSSGAITFFLVHGSATVIAFRLRRETNYDRIRALLEYPVRPVLVFAASLFRMILFGCYEQ